MADEGVATAIEMAQYMAGHADPRTTKLYDGRQQKVTREVERIRRCCINGSGLESAVFCSAD
jgi:hypothetical protein